MEQIGVLTKKIVSQKLLFVHKNVIDCENAEKMYIFFNIVQEYET